MFEMLHNFNQNPKLNFGLTKFVYVELTFICWLKKVSARHILANDTTSVRRDRVGVNFINVKARPLGKGIMGHAMLCYGKS